MTAEDLRAILVSSEFKQELEEISSYLASTAQERPIINLLARCLWKQGHKYALEYDRSDLWVNGTHLEFKFNYDRCMEGLRIELIQCGGNLAQIQAAFLATKNNFGNLARIYKDVCKKKRDLFVWIICSRDLSHVSSDDGERICRWKEQKKYNKTHPFNSDREFLRIADSFLEVLQGEASFSVVKLEIATNGDFPSIYHFRICQFLKDP